MVSWRSEQGLVSGRESRQNTWRGGRNCPELEIVSIPNVAQVFYDWYARLEPPCVRNPMLLIFQIVLIG